VRCTTSWSSVYPCSRSWDLVRVLLAAAHVPGSYAEEGGEERVVLKGLISGIGLPLLFNITVPDRRECRYPSASLDGSLTINVIVKSIDWLILLSSSSSTVSRRTSSSFSAQSSCRLTSRGEHTVGCCSCLDFEIFVFHSNVPHSRDMLIHPGGWGCRRLSLANTRLQRYLTPLFAQKDIDLDWLTGEVVTGVHKT
jgi:hypothetical protein